MNEVMLIPSEQRSQAVQAILVKQNLQEDYKLNSFVSLQDATAFDPTSLGRLENVLQKGSEALGQLVEHFHGQKFIRRVTEPEFNPRRAILYRPQFRDKFLLMAFIQHSEVPDVFLRTSLITNRLKNEFDVTPSSNATAQVNSLIDQGIFAESKTAKVGHTEKLFYFTELGLEQARRLAADEYDG